MAHCQLLSDTDGFRLASAVPFTGHKLSWSLPGFIFVFRFMHRVMSYYTILHEMPPPLPKRLFVLQTSKFRNHYSWTFKAQVVTTYYHARFNTKNFAFWPHNVFMCSVWFSQQTTTISLYSTHRLVLLMEAHCYLRSMHYAFIYRVVQESLDSRYCV